MGKLKADISILAQFFFFIAVSPLERERDIPSVPVPMKNVQNLSQKTKNFSSIYLSPLYPKRENRLEAKTKKSNILYLNIALIPTGKTADHLWHISDILIGTQLCKYLCTYRIMHYSYLNPYDGRLGYWLMTVD